MRPTGQSATRAPPPYQKPSTVSTRPPRSSFPFIPSTSFRRLTFFSEASDANAYPRRDRSPDGSKNCMPLPKKPEFARIYSPVAGLLVLFCILIIARYARLGYGGVSRIFRWFACFSTLGAAESNSESPGSFYLCFFRLPTLHITISSNYIHDALRFRSRLVPQLRDATMYVYRASYQLE